MGVEFQTQYPTLARDGHEHINVDVAQFYVSTPFSERL